MGNVDKAFLTLGSKPMVAYSLLAFENSPSITHIVMVVRRERVDAAKEMAKIFGISKLSAVVAGGASRQASAAKGLAALPPEVSFVAVHDAARPMVTPELISLCVESARKKGSGVAAHRVFDTLKDCDKFGKVIRTIPRERLWAAETPQVFPAKTLREAYEKLNESKAAVTDDAEAVELLGQQVSMVEWKRPNPKITVVEDMQTVAMLMSMK